MDYFIIVTLTVSALYFHWWLYVRFKRWGDRDLALSLAGSDPEKKAYMLQRLSEAASEGVKRKELASWLEQVAADYPVR